MKTLFASCLCLALILSACVSRSKSKAQAQAAFQAGQQQAAAQQQPAKMPSVTFLGEVKNHTIPWTEDLSLAQALVAAEYTALWDPHTITINRKGEKFAINPRRFIRGQDDPLLEPGDVIEVRR